ncbi:MAG: purine-nucleoside phosphorylase [Alphaproteobacteria bacterium]|nr:purine-nucleoside phosphorylase [Alphaproteobacteria bacterium]
MIKETASFIKNKLDLKNPEVAVILGSGLGRFSETLENISSISYASIPNFPQSSVSGHKGELIKGYIKDKEVICLNGRFHLYEGHNPRVILDIIHILKELGVKRLIVTNAAGSLRLDMPPGSIMLIKDHINFSGRNPLVGPNDDNYGPRFPALNNAYSLTLRNLCKKTAQQLDIELKEGTYFYVLGPNFETSAEIKAFALLGGDAVGCSTVPEVISAIHCSIDVLGLSVITNYGAGMQDNTPSHQETLSQANKASEKLIKLVATFIKEE